MVKKIRKAVIPVAGLGTRGLPFTKEVPKELQPILDIPTIHFIVEEIVAAGIDQLIFITSKGKEAIEDYFDRSAALESWLERRGKTELLEKVRSIGKLCEVMSVRQKEPLGLGHAVLCARHIVGDEPFAVCLGDEIFPPWEKHSFQKSPLSLLVDTYEKFQTSAVGVVEIPIEDSRSYGMVDTKGGSLSNGPLKIHRTVEKPAPEKAPSRYAIVGRYVFEPNIFDALSEVKPGVGGEIQLTDGMDTLCSSGKIMAVEFTGRRYDIGNLFYYVKAQIDLALQRPEVSARLVPYLKQLVGEMK